MSAIIHIEGRAGRDAEPSQLPNGTDVCKVSVAVTIYKGRDKESVTNWYNVAMFGNASKLLADVRKGDSLLVCGTLEVRDYTAKDGSAKYSLDINGQYFTNLSKFVKPREEGSAPPPRRESASSASAPDDLPF